MHTRRLAALVLGLWLGCGIFMGWVATHNLTSVQQIISHPRKEFQAEVEQLGQDRVRSLLRFQAGELNRHYFRWWELVQIVVGFGLGLLLLFATNGNRLVMTLVTGMVAIVVVQHLTITPQILELGRGLDFLPPGEISKERAAFRNYHGFYSTLELVKLLAGLGLAARLLYSSPSHRRKRSKPVAADPLQDD